MFSLEFSANFPAEFSATNVLEHLLKGLNPLITPEFLNKKHVKFDQGLDFLISCQGNRGENHEKPRKNNEKLRKN